MKVLLTGASGFIGSHLLPQLLLKGHKVCALYFKNKVNIAGIESQRVDITKKEDVERVLNYFAPQAVIHLAAQPFVPEAEKDFQHTLNLNVLATANICDLLLKNKIKAKFIYISSGEVYGKVSEDALPITEEQECKPVNNYALSKVMAEFVVKKYCLLSNNQVVIFRPFNQIGPGQSARFVTASFAKQLAEVALGKREPVIKVGNLSPKRDFMDVRDSVTAYEAALETGEGIYNLASGRSTAIKDILNLLIAISGVNVEVVEDPALFRRVDLPRVEGSYKKAERDFGWKPVVPLEQSLRDLYNYWKEQVR
ncbi:MAG: NAD-dependent epimerase/dehydratase family protein [Candidatus Dadabacteria bacterium]|nr:MAG: NAD-dependent epimerase/dehydratase family protein [Candidatus Dadabacteria bacterium]